MIRPRFNQFIVIWLSLHGVALGDGESPDIACSYPVSVYRNWQTFTARDGLPDADIRAVQVFGDQVWVAAAGGLALLSNGAWQVWTEENGLPYPTISAIAVDPRTHDVWLGSWGGGLIRFSGGRFDKFDQLNSGLAGNLVFAVACTGDRVWAATNGGLSSFDPVADSWALHFERRTDTADTVITSLSFNDHFLYAAAWCEGIWQLDLRQGTWSFMDSIQATGFGFQATGFRLPSHFDESVTYLAVQDDKREEASVRSQRFPFCILHSPFLAQLEVIKVGVLRPGDRKITLPGSLSAGRGKLGHMDQLAASLAIEQANARGGYRGQTPFALATGPDGAFRGWGWTTPEDDLPALAVQRDVFGIVGFLGPNARITSAAVLGTEVPLVNFAPTLPTIDEIINPWIFRCRGDEPRRLRLVLDYIIDQLGCTRIAVVRTPDSTGDSHLEWYVDQARRRGYPVVADVSYEPGVGDLDSGLRKVRESGAQAVLTWCDLNRSVQILKHMREIGMTQLFLGGEEIANRAFIESAGDRAGRVIAAWPQVDRAHPNAVAEFTQAYVARFKRQPSPYAFGIYEATNHLLSAIDSAGADRWAVRQALGRMSNDAVGEMHSERFSPRPRDVILGALTGGLWQLKTTSDLDVEPSDGVP